jgi:putative ABC transport system permease protein
MNFAKLVIIANAVSWPTAYLVMQRWLQDYAYRTSIGMRIKNPLNCLN